MNERHQKELIYFILKCLRETWKVEIVIFHLVIYFFSICTLTMFNISLCFRLFMEDFNERLCKTGSKYSSDLSAEPKQQCGGY